MNGSYIHDAPFAKRLQHTLCSKNRANKKCFSMANGIYSTVGWKCPVHRGFGNLNRCAWPGCPHGVAENSLEANSMIPGSKTETFCRVVWYGLGGEEYFEWQTNVMPTWFRLHGPFNHFARKIREHVTIDQMFHYTSADGALSILQSGRMRFTDYAFLNDTREIAHGIDIIRSVLTNEKHAAGSRASTKLRSHLDEVDPFSSYQIYTASFSSKSDSLSQFRLYGPLAIGFETDPTWFSDSKGDVHFDRVVYDPDKQSRLIEVFLHLFRQSEEKDAALIAGDEKERVTTDYLISQLLRIVAFFKHPAFSDEREVRIVYSEPLETMKEFGVDLAKRQFRVSGGLIVPFTDTFDMSRQNDGDTPSAKLPLKSVVIGPVAQAETLAKGMRGLLDANGYNDVDVHLSEAPFRT